MMCRTFRISTANCITDKQFRSVCTTRLAMLRWTNNSPGASPTIWFAGTRLSEQPIQRYFGDCCRDSSRKNSGFTCRIPSDQARLLSKRWLSVSIEKSADYADFTDKKLPSVAAVYDRRVLVFQNPWPLTSAFPTSYFLLPTFDPLLPTFIR